ncbi:Zinc metalloprotease zmpB precursor [Streptococcus sp. DD10]|uniref:ZmpA/ZmpB/ZmpC family metallo-endopeptidase n=1 Tax=Streptococcus sp. DD10 TaxID=1777878 RepID=UPI00079506CF|nr:ZmpA/ZmpB/ZmpC family metallo-endopeptidase [Streptococcus sp. DD10]KXT73821.1 Zinc metalloprotease zmpB precursor [Streptococcus sp. DD10]
MEKRQRFGIRKFGSLVASVVIGVSWFTTVHAQSKVTQFQYLEKSELTQEQLLRLSYDNPQVTEDVYYLVYEPSHTALPVTAASQNTGWLLAGLTIGSLVIMCSKKRKKVLLVFLMTSSGLLALNSVQASTKLAQYNQELMASSVQDGVRDIPGYRYIGYFTEKDEEIFSAFKNASSKLEHSQTRPNTHQHNSISFPQAVFAQNGDEDGKPAIQEELPEAVIAQNGDEDGKPAVQEELPEAVVTQNGDKDGKPAIQEELPEAVIAQNGDEDGKPAIQEELPEAIIAQNGDEDGKPAIQEELPEAVVTQNGDKDGKPAIQEELPEAIIAQNGDEDGKPAIQEELPEAVIAQNGDEDGKPAIQEELPEAVVTQNGDEDGKPAIQEELPEAIIAQNGDEDGKPAIQEELPQAVIAQNGDKDGKPAIQEELPEAVIAQNGDKDGKPAIQEELPEAVIAQNGDEDGKPAIQEELPEAIIAQNGDKDGKPAIQEELPEAVVTQNGDEDGKPVIQEELPEAVIAQNGDEDGKPAIQEELPEAVIAQNGDEDGKPAIQEELPEAVIAQNGDEDGKPAIQEELPEALIRTVIRQEEIPISQVTEMDDNLFEGETKQELGQTGQLTITTEILTDADGNDIVISENRVETRPMIPHKTIIGRKKQEITVEKSIELREVTSAQLFKKDGNNYIAMNEIENAPSDLSNYYVKVASSKFKDLFLPITAVKEVTKDNQTQFEFTASLDKLKQAENTSDYQDGYRFFVQKFHPSINNVYTSVNDLVTAMNKNPAGTYILGSNMDFSNLTGTGTIIKGEFSGSLTGKNGDTQYAMYGLTRPFFDKITSATLKDIVIKDATIIGKEQLGTLAVSMDGGHLENISVTGKLKGNRDIGGIIYKVDNRTEVRNVHFTGSIEAPANTGGSSRIGGLFGHLGRAFVDTATAKVDIKVKHPANRNYTTGGLVGLMSYPPLWERERNQLQNAYVEGTITNSGSPDASVGGAIGSNMTNGNTNNLLANVAVENGYQFYGATHVNDSHAKILKNNLLGSKSRGKTDIDKIQTRLLSDEEVKAKVSELTAGDIGLPLAPTFTNPNAYHVDYSRIKGYQKEYNQAYKNLEYLIPYYNKEEIVKLGNHVTGNLLEKEIKQVFALKDEELHPYDATKLLVLYTDKTRETFDLTDKTSFTSRLLEYKLAGTNLVYTPTLLAEQTDIDTVKEALASVSLYSDAVYTALNLTTNQEISVKRLYFDEGLLALKENLDETVKLLLENGANPEDIISHKEKIALALIHVANYYNFKVGDVRTKNFLLNRSYPQKANLVETLISLGGNFSALRGANSASSYTNYISSLTGINSLDDFFNYHRELLSDFHDNDSWFKDAVKNHVVLEERQSTVEEIKQAEYRAFAKLKHPDFINYLLPLLNLQKSQLYLISNYSTLVFGSRDREPQLSDQAWKAAIKKAADAHRDYLDTWYRIAEDNVKSRLVKDRNLPVWDGYNQNGWVDEFGRYGQQNEFRSLREFFGPIGKYYGNNWTGAYALIGIPKTLVHYILLGALDEYGQSVFTHEVTHVYDDSIYLGGYGKREGQDFEAYAQGLLQSPRDGGEIGINLMFTKPNDGTRYYNPSPEQFRNKADIDAYMRRYIDTLMVLAHAETDAVLAANNPELINKWFKKMDKLPHPNAKNDNERKDQLDLVRDLTKEERDSADHIQSINDLIDRNYISIQYAQGNGKYDGRGLDWDTYTTPHMLSNIYGGNTSDGGAGAISFKNNAFYMWGYYGYSKGFLGYASNKHRHLAQAKNERLSDKLIIQTVSEGRFETLEDWKKAYFSEVKERAKTQFKPVTVNGISYSSYQELVDAFRNLLTGVNTKNQQETNRAREAVYKLKEQIYKTWLKDTNGFQENTIGNQ